MRLTTKGCYGLRAMLELGEQYGAGPVLMRSIAEKQEVSRKYLHALLTSLRAAGLVNSVRGSGGGYVLARDPSAIKLKEIIQVLEGSLSFADCVRDETICTRTSQCASYEVWKLLDTVIDKHLSQLTLKDLLTIQAEKAALPLMYHI
jgi:Rrf2 family protein